MLYMFQVEVICFICYSFPLLSFPPVQIKSRGREEDDDEEEEEGEQEEGEDDGDSVNGDDS